MTPEEIQQLKLMKVYPDDHIQSGKCFSCGAKAIPNANWFSSTFEVAGCEPYTLYVCSEACRRRFYTDDGTPGLLKGYLSPQL